MSALDRGALEVRDGYLCVGGVPARPAAARVGTTPFFAYDRALVTERVAELRGRSARGGSISAMRSRPTRCRRWSST